MPAVWSPDFSAAIETQKLSKERLLAQKGLDRSYSTEVQDSFFFNLPKVELHAHLNGSLSIETIKSLIADAGITETGTYFLEQPTTMEEVFKVFPVIHNVMQTYDAVKKASIDVVTNFNKENTIYLELRTTPKKTEKLTRRQYVAAVVEGIRVAPSTIVVRLILSIDRRNTLEDAEETINLAIENESGIIVGVELSGNPELDGRQFIPLLQKARNHGLGISVHLAEVSSNVEEVDAFLEFGPDRIGHGTFLHRQHDHVLEKWGNAMLEKKIALEICLTSNVMCRTTETAADSHLPLWRSIGVPVAICTDDCGLMGISLSSEHELASKAFDYDKETIRQIVLDGLSISFLQKGSDHYKQLEEKIKNFHI